MLPTDVRGDEEDMLRMSCSKSSFGGQNEWLEFEPMGSVV